MHHGVQLPVFLKCLRVSDSTDFSLILELAASHSQVSQAVDRRQVSGKPNVAVREALECSSLSM